MAIDDARGQSPSRRRDDNYKIEIVLGVNLTFYF